MGYSHSWSHETEIPAATWMQITGDARRLIAAFRPGLSELEIDNDWIILNGAPPDDFETFGQMIGHAVWIVGTHILQAEPVNQKLAQLINAGSERLNLCQQGLIIEPLRRHWIDLAHHTNTGGRGRNHDLGLAKNLYKAANQGEGFALVTSVKVHLPTAGLLFRKRDGMSQAFE